MADPVPSDADRVLRVITRLNIGGPARHALALSRRLPPRWPTRLVAGRPTPSEGELTDPAVLVTHVPLVRSVSPASDLRALVALRGILATDRPALLHTHMAKAGTLGRLAAASVRPRPRTVHTFHGHVLDGYFSTAVQRSFVAAERVLARRTDLLVAVSAEIRDQLLELGIGDPDRFRVVPLGLELAAHRAISGRIGTLRDAIGVPASAPLVGAVGRLVPIKDHATLLDAMTRLPDAHLAVIGDGVLRAELEARAAGLGLSARVHFTGWRLDVPAVMADLDVVVLSSRNEGTPVSLIEAAACGRPVVATDVGGVRSVVAHGETGIVVPPGDPAMLAAAIEQLLRDRALADRLGAAGRRRSNRFDEDRLVRDVDRLYTELLA